MDRKRLLIILGVVALAIGMLLIPLAVLSKSVAAAPNTQIADSISPPTRDGQAGPTTSPRLIVQFTSPSLAEEQAATGFAPQSQGRMDLNSSQAQAYITKLKTEQAAFVSRMQQALPGASVGQYINELGARVDLTYQVTFNGMAVDIGSTRKEQARKVLSALPGVKAVYLDYAHQPDLYASIPLINAAAAWDNPAIGGMENAGAGIKIATIDGGIHHDAPMFDGAGYTYPPGYPHDGLGLTTNNNGKIIASRVYFRTWDPPAPGDENPWPGERGTPHGNFTSGIAAGEQVEASYLGITETISGVAPQAWLMSYRAFYYSVTGNESAYDAELITAIEDVVKDGANVVNNSWGGGPGSVGGEFDPLDQALINASKAGVFVSMSAGNAGPNNGTTDHPSSDYIDVAASTTDGTFTAGQLSVIAPEPVSDTLKAMPFTAAGATLELGNVYTFTFRVGGVISPTNFEGCSPWPADTFDGVAAVVSRGTCTFTDKALNAQNAGAAMVIVYNHVAGGDDLVNMAIDPSVTIPALFVGHSDGVAMEDWYTTYGDASIISYDTKAHQIGNTPDVIAGFSSRGPGVGNVLKPDITAPGVNILSQGYTPGATGEARHLGFGQASGTSFSAPHVSGAAALLRQIHPDWTNAEIKSALMSTSKYIGIWNNDGSHAQPLDMGAGRLDLTNAADPGVILDAPSLGYGQIVTGTMKSMNVMVTNVAGITETYSLEAQKVTGTYPVTPTVSSLPGFAVSPASISLAPGATTMITVTFDSSDGAIGDNQGYILLDGSVHDAHFPVWARVTPPSAADVLIIDNDASSSLGFPDYLGYYTTTLTNLGLTYEVLDTDNLAGPGVFNFVPEEAVLSSYKIVIYFTGDNYLPNGTFTVATPLTARDMDRLTEFANSGGIVFAMGQDMASVLNSTSSSTASFFYSSVLGGDYLQDSVTNFDLPSQAITPRPDAPDALRGVSLDLNGPSETQVTLTGANETPPVSTDNQAVASFGFNAVTNELSYNVDVFASQPMTVTASHIHTGTVGTPGPIIYPLYTPVTPTLVTDTLNFHGSVILTDPEVTALFNDGLYINVHTTAHPGGELRAQLSAAVNGDGAANQYFIDEIRAKPNFAPDPVGNAYQYKPLLQYAGPYNSESGQGTVAMSHRDQPTLENPGLAYLGRSIYSTFGLEGVNNGLSSTSREDLISAYMDWAMDEPTATISNTTPTNASNQTMFEATVSSNIGGTTGKTYRWDFGDGSGYSNVYTSNQAGHTYATCGNYTVRVEATDSWGNTTIGELDTDVTNCVGTSPMYVHFLPIVVTSP